MAYMLSIINTNQSFLWLFQNKRDDSSHLHLRGGHLFCRHLVMIRFCANAVT